MNLSFDVFMEKNAEKLAGQKVLVAFSGGKDSCALLHWVSKNREKLKITLGACHVNHMIRGANAERDEQFCRSFCLKRGINFFAEKRNVPLSEENDKYGLEHAARKFRYEALEEVAKREGYDLILTAHTKDDMAETFFIRVFQGTSLSTLGGIRKKRGMILRPMLEISTENVFEYISANNIETTFDETNDDTAYLRNWVRCNIMTEIKKYNPAFLDKVISLMEQSAELGEYLEKRCKDTYLLEGNVYKINIDKLMQMDALERSWVIRDVLTTLFRAEKRHVDSILRLIGEDGSLRINLPDGFCAETSYGILRIFHIRLLEPVSVVKKQGQAEVKIGGRLIKFSGGLENEEILLRTRRQGDRLGKDKLKDVFIDKKIELFYRDTALLAERNNIIIWVENLFDNGNIILCTNEDSRR